MSKLPGLTRSDDRPSVSGANRGRIQVQNPIREVGLRPQARPVDTYARPQQPNTGPSGLAQLAGALAQISPSLQNFIDTDAERRKKEAEDRAARRIGGMSFEEARSAVESGQMAELDNPWFKAAFMKQYGERLAYHRVNELTAEYETNFDKENGDLDAFIRERTAGDLEQYGDSPHFTGAYGNIMDQFGAKANTSQAQYQTERVKEDTIGGVYDTFHGQARQMLEDGASPEDVVNALRANYEGNRSLLHVDYREQDREMVRLAESFANEGNLDMARAILLGDRKGADGTVLGPLAANREFQADANRILNAAEREMFNVNEEVSRDRRFTFWDQAREGKLDRDELMGWHRGNPGAFSEAQVQSLINQNDTYLEQEAAAAARGRQELELRAAARQAEEDLTTKNLDLAGRGMLPYIQEVTVPTEAGGTRTVSVEEQSRAVASEIVRRTEWKVDQGTATADEAFAMQVDAFTGNNLVQPVWKSVLTAAPVAATQFNLSGGDIPPALQDGVDLYMRLHAANPALLDKHISDANTRDFFESYRVATQIGQMAPEQAMQTAMMMASDPSKFQSTAVQQRFDQIDSRVQDVTVGGFMGWFGSAPSNAGFVANEIGRLGKFYAQNGMGADAALDEAKKRFLATHTPVNGNYIYTADKNLPENFGELAESAIKTYVADFGEAEGVEASDLTIRPAANGNGWVIVHSVGQYPVENSERANINTRTLFEMEADRRLKLRDGIVTDQNTRQERQDARALGNAERWLADPSAYQMYANIYGQEEADRMKREHEETVRRHKPN